MAFFNALSVCFRKAGEARPYDVTVEECPKMGCGARVVDWLKRAVSYPIHFAHKVYSTYLFAKHRELLAPLKANVFYPALISKVPLFGDEHPLALVTDPSIMKAILKEARKGKLFEDRANTEVFTHLFQTLYPGKEITPNDFLFMCEESHVMLFRKPIAEFVAARNRSYAPKIVAIVQATLDEIEKSGASRIESLKKMTGCFTTRVISEILLGIKCDFAELYEAVNFIAKFVMMRRWNRNLSQEDQEKFSRGKDLLVQAIDRAQKNRESGTFVEALEKGGLTDLQIKTTLALMFIAGAQTSADVLRYALWQLGRNPEDQKTNLTPLYIDESLRLMPPVYIIGRCAAKDLRVVVRDKRVTVMTYTILKGQKIILSPALAALDPAYRKNPHVFDIMKPYGSLFWNPFGFGKHSCPGANFANEEIMLFTNAFVSRFKFTSLPDKPSLSRKGYMTIEFEDVSLLLEKKGDEVKKS